MTNKSKTSNAWAHVLAQVGDVHDTAAQATNKREMNSLLREATVPTNQESSSFVQPEYYHQEEDDILPQTTNLSGARVGQSDCFSSFRNAFMLRQTLAALRQSHTRLPNGEADQNQPQMKDCLGKLYQALNMSYSRSVEYYNCQYNNSYYGKQIDHSKLREMAASSVNPAFKQPSEIEELNPDHIPLDEEEKEADFESLMSNDEEIFGHHQTMLEDRDFGSLPQNFKRDTPGYAGSSEKVSRKVKDAFEWRWVLDSLRETGQSLGITEPEKKQIDHDKLKRLRDQAIGLPAGNPSQESSSNSPPPPTPLEIHNKNEALLSLNAAPEGATRSLSLLKPWYNPPHDDMETQLESMESHLREEKHQQLAGEDPSSRRQSFEKQEEKYWKQKTSSSTGFQVPTGMFCDDDEDFPQTALGTNLSSLTQARLIVAQSNDWI